MTNSIVRKLPIGIQTFEKIREGNYVYVDKTEWVWRMASLETPFFLSRPRRFGKSLLLSTFEAYFKGRKDLFKGLAIERLEQDWIEYPVIHLDLNAKKFDTGEDLIRLVDRQLLVYEAIYGSSDADETIDDRLFTLLRLICEQTGKRVVVLVDEYDKPLLQSFDNEKLQEEYRLMLKAFYGVLKSADRYLRFVFLTGVTKFSQVSVFSDLNQLNDKTERHYQVVFYLVFKLMGQFTEAEVRSARGRADAVVKTPKYIYVFEFKLNGTAEEAIWQIDEKGYLVPYQADGRKLIKVGVEFSAIERNISRWLYF